MFALKSLVAGMTGLAGASTSALACGSECVAKSGGLDGVTTAKAGLAAAAGGVLFLAMRPKTVVATKGSTADTTAYSYPGGDMM